MLVLVSLGSSGRGMIVLVLAKCFGKKKKSAVRSSNFVETHLLGRLRAIGWGRR